MARPKSNSTQPSAVEKMRGAFWGLLAQKSYDEFTIKDVCEQANVQRNTFYYHYDGIADLAADAIAQLPVEYFACGMLELLRENDLHPANYIFSKQNKAFIGSMFLVAGPNSTPALAEAIKDRVWKAWGSLLDLPEERSIGAEFALGGMFAALGKLGQLSPKERKAELEKTPITKIVPTLFQQLFGITLDTAKVNQLPPCPQSERA